VSDTLRCHQPHTCGHVLDFTTHTLPDLAEHQLVPEGTPAAPSQVTCTAQHGTAQHQLLLVDTFTARHYSPHLSWHEALSCPYTALTRSTAPACFIPIDHRGFERSHLLCHVPRAIGGRRVTAALQHQPVSNPTVHHLSIL
jgi:hypothetical protein